MLNKINKINNWQASLTIVIIGLLTFFTGLLNPFLGDDKDQIINNIPVHSIANIRLFFEGGTFYTGQGIAPLSGAYYRPLMTTSFSMLYSLFGSHSFYFHIFQLALYIASAIMVFLVFRYFFKPSLALFLALVFLVHPLNSQVVFAIPSMQDVLFFFFGIMAIWLLIRFSSIKSLWLVALCLLLSLLSKETGVAFAIMALLYLFWFNRQRLWAFVGIMVPPVVLYLVLKISAVGLKGYLSNNAQIENLHLFGRLLNAPSIILFYVTKFVWPLKLATGYYWAYSSLSLSHVLLPLIIDVLLLSLIVYIGIILYRKLPRDQFLIYAFFTSWTVIGLLLYLQIIPLDMTACDNWFYFSMFGLLGMIGVVMAVFLPRISPYWLLVIAVLLIGTLGFRSALRGHDYRSQTAISNMDIANSKYDYAAYNILAQVFINKGDFADAKIYAEDSISLCHTYVNYNNLGVALSNLGDYQGAYKAYVQGLKYGNFSQLYDNLGSLTLVYGNPVANKQFLLSAVNVFPKDATLWTYLAILEYRYSDFADSKAAITNAVNDGQVPQFIYNGIMNNQPIIISFSNTSKSITIQ